MLINPLFGLRNELLDDISIFVLNTINMEGRLRSAHGAGDLAEYRYLLQDSGGAFHVSQAFSDITSTTYSATISRSAGDLSWFAYTPFGMGGNAAGDDTIGAASSPSLIDFSGIGLLTATEDDDQNWAEHNTRFFQVDVVAAVPEPSVMVLLGLGLAGLVLFRRCPLRF